MTQATESALRAAIDGAGGPKRVGVLLRPEMDPVLAAQWISHCLSLDHRAKFSLDQIALIFRRAFESAQHDGFKAFAEQLGYRVVGIEPQAELAETARRAVAAADLAMELSAKVRAQMEHAHIKVD